MTVQDKKTAKPADEPQVYKEEDYAYFIECVKDGLWNNNTYLAELCGVERETIAKWKKTKPVVEARRQYSNDLRKEFKTDGTIEKKMKEAGMEVESEQTQVASIIVKIEDYGSKKIEVK